MTRSTRPWPPDSRSPSGGCHPAARLRGREPTPDAARRHISTIAERGRMAWQKTTGYGRRNLAGTAIGRYKALIGPRLRARNWRAQKAETAIAASVLNRMIQTAKPVCLRTA